MFFFYEVTRVFYANNIKQWTPASGGVKNRGDTETVFPSVLISCFALRRAYKAESAPPRAQVVKSR